MSDRPKRILIVDDEERNRELATAMVESFGHEADEARDGVEALAKLALAEWKASLAHVGLLQSDAATYAQRTRARRLRLRGLDEAAIQAKVDARTAARRERRRAARRACLGRMLIAHIAGTGEEREARQRQAGYAHRSIVHGRRARSTIARSLELWGRAVATFRARRSSPPS